MFWIGLIVGMMVGAFGGVLVAALCMAASDRRIKVIHSVKESEE